MKDNMDIKVETRWDKAVVPADTPRQRGLLVDILGIREQQQTERRPVNLALVIDRSGSMGHGKIEAAKQAARGVVDRLGDEDVLSVVDFDDEISTLLSGIRLKKDGKAEAIRAIDRLFARGTTNLAGGWLEGATRAANVMDTMGFKSGHVVLLSDGHANVGIQDPVALRNHADEMASRGVTTSTVGVGNGYSPLQLEALSEGGLGRLHDAATPDEMIETILGELGEVVSIVATDVKLSLRWPRELRAELLADYHTSIDGNSMVVRLGQLVSGSHRMAPLMIDVPALPAGEVMKVEIAVTGKHPDSGDAIHMATTTATLMRASLRRSRRKGSPQDVIPQPTTGTVQTKPCPVSRWLRS